MKIGWRNSRAKCNYAKFPDFWKQDTANLVWCDTKKQALVGKASGYLFIANDDGSYHDCVPVTQVWKDEGLSSKTSHLFDIHAIDELAIEHYDHKAGWQLMRPGNPKAAQSAVSFYKFKAFLKGYKQSSDLQLPQSEPYMNCLGMVKLDKTPDGKALQPVGYSIIIYIWDTKKIIATVPVPLDWYIDNGTEKHDMLSIFNTKHAIGQHWIWVPDPIPGPFMKAAGTEAYTDFKQYELYQPFMNRLRNDKSISSNIIECMQDVLSVCKGDDELMQYLYEGMSFRLTKPDVDCRLTIRLLPGLSKAKQTKLLKDMASKRGKDQTKNKTALTIAIESCSFGPGLENKKFVFDQPIQVEYNYDNPMYLRLINSGHKPGNTVPRYLTEKIWIKGISESGKVAKKGDKTKYNIAIKNIRGIPNNLLEEARRSFKPKQEVVGFQKWQLDNDK